MANLASTEARCADCGTPAPDLEDGTTLRSSAGWRFMPERRPDGSVVASWHCPSCWSKRKEQKKAGA